MTIDEVNITSHPKVKKITFSTFEKKLHVSLDGRHDKFDYVVGNTAQKPLFFQAAVFLHNATTTLAVHKIEGKIMPFDSTQLKITLVVIQRNRILHTIPVSSSLIRKKRITFDINDVYLETGEFYVLYVLDFLKPAVATIITNNKKRSQIFAFSLNNGEIKLTRNTFDKQWQHAFPAPQFKITAIEI